MISPILYKHNFVSFKSNHANLKGNITFFKGNNNKEISSPVTTHITDKSGSNEMYSLQKFNIPNFAVLPNNSARGESLSSPKNRKYIKFLKNKGIDTIIDLREKYKSESYEQLCKEHGLKYYNIPIDSSSVSDEDVINSLPLLFKLINKGGFYIACAQGLHRTDIALSLNYVFNPKKQDIPVLYGHERSFGLKVDDISRRLNSVKNKISDDKLSELGWENREKFEHTFTERKNELYSFNKAYINLKRSNRSL